MVLILMIKTSVFPLMISKRARPLILQFIITQSQNIVKRISKIFSENKRKDRGRSKRLPQDGSNGFSILLRHKAARPVDLAQEDEAKDALEHFGKGSRNIEGVDRDACKVGEKRYGGNDDAPHIDAVKQEGDSHSAS